MAESREMNIGIDINCLLFDRSGFGRYTENLVKNLLLIDHKNEYFLYANFIRKSQERRKIIHGLIQETNAKNVTVKVFPLPAHWKEMLTGTSYSYTSIVKDPLDIYFAPHYAGIPKNGFSQMVVTIHDLVFIKYPEHRGRLSDYYLKRTKIAVEKSVKIIADSESTKKDLIDLLDVNADKIKVIYLGVDEQFKVYHQNEIIARTQKYVPTEQKYILSVGTLEPRKNLSMIVKAFSLLPIELQQTYKIVFTGGKGWNNQALAQTIADYNLKDRVIFTGFVSDEDLPYLYNRADLFIYPSLYEGFGLPVLEAMACGAPIITSNVSSLPEVVGKAGILIDPKNEQEIAHKMKQILTNPKLADDLRKKGPLQAKKFTWKKTAQETLKIFERIEYAK